MICSSPFQSCFFYLQVQIKVQNGGSGEVFAYEGVLLPSLVPWFHGFNVFNHFISIYCHDYWMSVWPLIIPGFATWWTLFGSGHTFTLCNFWQCWSQNQQKCG